AQLADAFAHKYTVNSLYNRSPETPKIQVFRENDKSDTEFLLVCLITGFYPDVIKVYWKPDGEQSKWETDPVEKENGETSYVISRFNVTQLQWKNSKVICGVQHESSKDNIEVHPSCFCMTIRFCMSYFYFLRISYPLIGLRNDRI
uniref:Ig-like domain-containing protein n=1 Tax=Callorhinchus milii TaxID=7868 RepID=A0A4W3JBI2_CALMI